MSKTTWSNGQTTQDPHVINFIPLSITFQSPDWVFHPHLQYLSCGLNVQRPSIDQTLGQQEDPGWMFWGVTGKSHQRLQVGKAFQPGWSRKTAGEKPLSAVVLSLLCSDPKSSTAAGQIWAVGSGMAPELEVGALLGLSCAGQKEIPADKLIFALVVYLG